jgi:hypothetical protein
MTETMRDVMSEPVEIRGATILEELTPDSAIRFRTPAGQMQVNNGGYLMGLAIADSGVARLELRGFDSKNRYDATPLFVGDFEYTDEARAEFGRLAELLFLREKIMDVLDKVGPDGANILPAFFIPTIKAGDFSVLEIAADYAMDQGREADALLLRAMYYRVTLEVGQSASEVGKKVSIHYGTGRVLMVTIVKPGESIRIVSLGYSGDRFDKEFKVGDYAEHGRYNLIYYGLIKSITAKSVMVTEDKYSMGGKVKRMTITQFANDNYNFDHNEAAHHNANYMD